MRDRSFGKFLFCEVQTCLTRVAREICDMDSSELENVASTLFNAEGECKNVDGPPGELSSK